MNITTSHLSKTARLVLPGSFEMSNHFYTRVLNAQLHPMVSFFMNLSNERIIKRYAHLNPQVDTKELEKILTYKAKYLFWAGSDLFHVTTAEGIRHMVIIETNSCPSGQKSMPLTNEHQEQGGYLTIIKEAFLHRLKKRGLPAGGVAVIYDKNDIETGGYAAIFAEVLNEPVFLVSYFDEDPDPPVRFTSGVMEVRDLHNTWHPIRIAFRYVTQRPWNRIPIHSKTLIINPILSCLAGGRNKMVAAKAYELYNAELSNSGLSIKIPETIKDVEKNEIPLWVKKFGGYAVIKIPYSNAGQGVYTITSEKELETFMNEEHYYNKFIVQSLIGNFHWSSTSEKGRFYHVGTVPNKKNKIFVADLRMMVASTEGGFKPIAIYSRKSKLPLEETIPSDISSWDMLGTNLSIKLEDGTFTTDTTRLLLMDRKDFNSQGLDLDNLIEAYIQTVLSVIAIDKMAQNLTNQKGRFRKKLFTSLNDDPSLLNELLLD